MCDLSEVQNGIETGATKCAQVTSSFPVSDDFRTLTAKHRSLHAGLRVRTHS